MPTIRKGQLIELEMPMPDLWERMFRGLTTNARTILLKLHYYVERDLETPGQFEDLTADEQEELNTIARALTEAAIVSMQMSDGVLVTTLDKVAENPSLLFGDLPAVAQWEIATDYQRADEKPGTFCTDVWGDEQTVCAYSLETPSEASTAAAAQAARRRINERRMSGRPQNSANRILANSLGKIFRSSGHAIARRREPSGRMVKNKVIYTENGQFHDFVKLIIPPLQLLFAERALPPVTIETIVRLAIQEFPSRLQPTRFLPPEIEETESQWCSIPLASIPWLRRIYYDQQSIQ